MKLPGLLSVLRGTEGYEKLRGRLRAGADDTSVALPPASLAYTVSALSGDSHGPILLVTARPDRARQLQEEIETWLERPEASMLFPDPDAMPYEPAAFDSPSQYQRLRVLLALNESKDGQGSRVKGQRTGARPLIVVVCASALMHQVLLPQELAAGTRTIRAGSRVDLSGLLSEWVSLGYELVRSVERPGTFSRRGGVLDIYPPTSLLPVRLDFYGDEVESLRHFDPLSQRSVRTIDSIGIPPANETGSTGSAAGIVDYLPAEATLIIEEPASVQAASETLDEQAQELLSQRIEAGEADAAEKRPYFQWPELKARLDAIRHRISTGPWDEVEAIALPFRAAPFFGGRLQLFLAEVQEARENGRSTVIASHQAGRLADVLGEGGISVPLLSGVTEAPLPGDTLLVSGSLQGGWSLETLMLLTDAEIFGWVKPRRAPVRKASGRDLLVSELQPGDYVVHVEHGIARFGGLERLTSDGADKEYMLLEYAGGDRLYVPLEQVDRVGRYLGGGAGEPDLTRLSSTDWSRTKDRARRSVAAVAVELLDIYAKRELASGTSFGPDLPWQREMEDAFPYIETPDQAQAIAEVKGDMESPRPMDRLICGDVGYGKTEVALRAAFKAVTNGKQVAVLVPTTVLAQQHFTTFSERLAAFPVKVDVLSRFRSEKQQTAILAELRAGAVDICIGTHRLLQKDVQFKELGLLIVDEEQRFGVMHKEHLKRLRKEVDVLTMTATPIPRSLYMSLVNVRDLSVIETPPDERLPIKTVVMPYDEPAIRHAILRELDRDGQVYFVHNRVQSIYRIAERLRELVPEARIGIGHGQMPEDELERVMVDFFAGRIDVLLCTTIIEAGLDVPNANTIIINMADRMGLAQLYQLRGRVGRGSNLAHAYLLYSRDRSMTQTAEERLRTIVEASELGAGYRIAMKDLEIRGAGNLLGSEQSGYIAAVGFDLYCSMLGEAVEQLKASQTGRPPRPPRPSTSIELPLTALLPENYVPDQSARISLYQRLARVDSLEAVLELREEIRDRFGPEPPEVAELLYVAGLKVRASLAGIASIAQRDGEIIVSTGLGGRLDRNLLAPLERPGVRVGSSQVRLEIPRLGAKWRAALGDVLQAMTKS